MAVQVILDTDCDDAGLSTPDEHVVDPNGPNIDTQEVCAETYRDLTRKYEVGLPGSELVWMGGSVGGRTARQVAFRCARCLWVLSPDRCLNEVVLRGDVSGGVRRIS